MIMFGSYIILAEGFLVLYTDNDDRSNGTISRSEILVKFPLIFIRTKIQTCYNIL